MSDLRPLRSVLWIALLALVAGCAEKTPEQRIAEARSKYRIEVNRCVPQQTIADVVEPENPPAGVFGDETDAGAGEDADGATADGSAADGEMADGMTDGEMADDGMAEDGMTEDAMAEPAAPVVATVMCDLVVRYDGRDPLPGVTIDLLHVDPFEATRNSFREYVETDGLMKGDTRQVSLVLDVPGFEEGDGIVLEPMRADIPAAERSEYREYSP